MITSSQVAALGFSRTLLTKYVNEGLLKRSRQGIYILPESIHDDMYTLMLRSENIIFSHDTALFLNDLSDRKPFTYSVTIPSNVSLPNSLKDECNCYYIKPELHKVGMEVRKTSFGNTVRCYNIERTTCDLLRSRSRCDEDVVISAVENYVSFKGKDLKRLAEYARYFRVQKELNRYMEGILR